MCLRVYIGLSKKLVLCHSKCLVSSYFFQKISFDFSFILTCICIFFKLSKLTYFHLIILTIEMEANKYFHHIRNFFIPWNVKVQIKHWKIDFLHFMDKVMWMIKHIKSGLQSFTTHNILIMIFLENNQCYLVLMGESQYTENYWNKVLKILCFSLLRIIALICDMHMN